MIRIATPADWYFLPDDGVAAEAAFLALLLNPGETWISAYGFTLQPMFDRILAADRAGIVVHMLLDHTQAAGAAEGPKVRRLAAQLVHGDITITTAGCGSRSTAQIWHEKAMVVRATDGGEDFCWQGSVNFSDGGWDQGNTASLFRCNAWSTPFIAGFEAHRDWARKIHPQWQSLALAA